MTRLPALILLSLYIFAQIIIKEMLGIGAVQAILHLLREIQVVQKNYQFATGSTMRAAVDAVRQQQPAELVVAVPVAPHESIEQLATLVDTVVCPAVPEWFFSVGQWYAHYEQTTDEQVRTLLQEAWRRERTRSAS